LIKTIQLRPYAFCFASLNESTALGRLSIFYDGCLFNFYRPDYDEDIDGHQWHFGLFLQQQWLQDQGQAAINELQNIRRVIHE